MSSSEGSAGHQPTSSGGSTGTAAGPLGDAMLVSKVLTYSDVSTEVARTGRIVLPRIQVQQCLPELLRLCQAEHVLPAVRNGGPVKLSVDLAVEDEAGRSWVVLMKTWQNVVSGEHRPTFVLENTADFVRANRLAQGDTLAFCPHNGRMLLRTSLRADQLLPRQLKRAGGGGAAAAAAATRRAPAKPLVAAPAWAETPGMSGSRKRKAPAFYADLAQLGPEADPWDSQPCNATEAAQALLSMHCSSSPNSSQSDQLALSRGGSDDVDGSHPAKAARTGSTSPASRSPPPPRSLYLPEAPLSALPAAGVPVPSAFRPQAVLEQAAAALAATQQQYTPLPPAPPLSPTVASPGGLPTEALVQAHSWLAAILAQQQQERRWVEQYNRMLLLQALQQEQQQRYASAAAAPSLHA